MAKNRKITTKQKAFIDAYVANNFNATQAALSAGYAKRSATAMASRLLTLDNVQAYLSKRIKQVLGNTDTLSVQLIQKLKDIAFSDVTDVMAWEADGSVSPIPNCELDKSKTYTISEVSSKAKYNKAGDLLGYDFNLKQVDKLKAIDILAKFCQLYEQGKPEERQETKTIDLTKKERTDKLLEYQERLSKLKGK